MIRSTWRNQVWVRSRGVRLALAVVLTPAMGAPSVFAAAQFSHLRAVATAQAGVLWAYATQAQERNFRLDAVRFTRQELEPPKGGLRTPRLLSSRLLRDRPRTEVEEQEFVRALRVLSDGEAYQELRQTHPQLLREAEEYFTALKELVNAQRYLLYVAAYHELQRTNAQAVKDAGAGDEQWQAFYNGTLADKVLEIRHLPVEDTEDNKGKRTRLQEAAQQAPRRYVWEIDPASPGQPPDHLSNVDRGYFLIDPTWFADQAQFAADFSRLVGPLRAAENQGASVTFTTTPHGGEIVVIGPPDGSLDRKLEQFVEPAYFAGVGGWSEVHDETRQAFHFVTDNVATYSQLVVQTLVTELETRLHELWLAGLPLRGYLEGRHVRFDALRTGLEQTLKITFDEPALERLRNAASPQDLVPLVIALKTGASWPTTSSGKTFVTSTVVGGEVTDADRARLDEAVRPVIEEAFDSGQAFGIGSIEVPVTGITDPIRFIEEEIGGEAWKQLAVQTSDTGLRSKVLGAYIKLVKAAHLRSHFTPVGGLGALAQQLLSHRVGVLVNDDHPDLLSGRESPLLLIGSSGNFPWRASGVDAPGSHYVKAALIEAAPDPERDAHHRGGFLGAWVEHELDVLRHGGYVDTAAQELSDGYAAIHRSPGDRPSAEIVQSAMRSLLVQEQEVGRVHIAKGVLPSSQDLVPTTVTVTLYANWGQYRRTRLIMRRFDETAEAVAQEVVEAVAQALRMLDEEARLALLKNPDQFLSETLPGLLKPLDLQPRQTDVWAARQVADARARAASEVSLTFAVEDAVAVAYPNGEAQPPAAMGSWDPEIGVVRRDRAVIRAYATFIQIAEGLPADQLDAIAAKLDEATQVRELSKAHLEMEHHRDWGPPGEEFHAVARTRGLTIEQASHLVSRLLADQNHEGLYGGRLLDLDPADRPIAQALLEALPVSHPVQDAYNELQEQESLGLRGNTQAGLIASLLLPLILGEEADEVLLTVGRPGWPEQEFASRLRQADVSQETLQALQASLGGVLMAVDEAGVDAGVNPQRIRQLDQVLSQLLASGGAAAPEAEIARPLHWNNLQSTDAEAALFTLWNNATLFLNRPGTAVAIAVHERPNHPVDIILSPYRNAGPIDGIRAVLADPRVSSQIKALFVKRLPTQPAWDPAIAARLLDRVLALELAAQTAKDTDAAATLSAKARELREHSDHLPSEDADAAWTAFLDSADLARLLWEARVTQLLRRTFGPASALHLGVSAGRPVDVTWHPENNSVTINVQGGATGPAQPPISEQPLSEVAAARLKAAVVYAVKQYTDANEADAPRLTILGALDKARVERGGEVPDQLFTTLLADPETDKLFPAAGGTLPVLPPSDEWQTAVTQALTPLARGDASFRQTITTLQPLLGGDRGTARVVAHIAVSDLRFVDEIAQEWGLPLTSSTKIALLLGGTQIVLPERWVANQRYAAGFGVVKKELEGVIIPWVVMETPADVSAVLQQMRADSRFVGAVVTTPAKPLVVSQAVAGAVTDKAHQRPRVQQSGAANLLMKSGGTLVADANDGQALVELCTTKEFNIPLADQDVVVIGGGPVGLDVAASIAAEGAASVTVLEADPQQLARARELLKDFSNIRVVSSHIEDTSDLPDLVKKATLLINASGAGMKDGRYEKVAALEDYNWIKSGTRVLDLIVIPEWTSLMKEAKQRGAIPYLIAKPMAMRAVAYHIAAWAAEATGTAVNPETVDAIYQTMWTYQPPQTPDSEAEGSAAPNKGSVGQALLTLHGLGDAELTYEQLQARRGLNPGTGEPYSLSTISVEVRQLESLGLVDLNRTRTSEQLRYTVRLKSDIRALPRHLVEQIAGLPAMDRSVIPRHILPRVKEDLQRLIHATVPDADRLTELLGRIRSASAVDGVAVEVAPGTLVYLDAAVVEEYRDELVRGLAAVQEELLQRHGRAVGERPTLSELAALPAYPLTKVDAQTLAAVCQQLGIWAPERAELLNLIRLHRQAREAASQYIVMNLGERLGVATLAENLLSLPREQQADVRLELTDQGVTVWLVAPPDSPLAPELHTLALSQGNALIRMPAQLPDGRRGAKVSPLGDPHPLLLAVAEAFYTKGISAEERRRIDALVTDKASRYVLAAARRGGLSGAHAVAELAILSRTSDEGRALEEAQELVRQVLAPLTPDLPHPVSTVAVNKGSVGHGLLALYDLPPDGVTYQKLRSARGVNPQTDHLYEVSTIRREVRALERLGLARVDRGNPRLHAVSLLEDVRQLPRGVVERIAALPGMDRYDLPEEEAVRLAAAIRTEFAEPLLRPRIAQIIRESLAAVLHRPLEEITERGHLETLGLDDVTIESARHPDQAQPRPLLTRLALELEQRGLRVVWFAKGTRLNPDDLLEGRDAGKQFLYQDLSVRRFIDDVTTVVARGKPLLMEGPRPLSPPAKQTGLTQEEALGWVRTQLRARKETGATHLALHIPHDNPFYVDLLDYDEGKEESQIWWLTQLLDSHHIESSRTFSVAADLPTGLDEQAYLTREHEATAARLGVEPDASRAFKVLRVTVLPGGEAGGEMFATRSDLPVVYEKAVFAQDLADAGLVTGGGPKATYIQATQQLLAMVVREQELDVAIVQGRSGATYRVSFERMGLTQQEIAEIAKVGSGESERYIVGAFQDPELRSRAPATAVSGRDWQQMVDDANLLVAKDALNALNAARELLQQVIQQAGQPKGDEDPHPAVFSAYILLADVNSKIRQITVEREAVSADETRLLSLIRLPADEAAATLETWQPERSLEEVIADALERAVDDPALRQPLMDLVVALARRAQAGNERALAVLWMLAFQSGQLDVQDAALQAVEAIVGQNRYTIERVALSIVGEQLEGVEHAVIATDRTTIDRVILELTANGAPVVRSRSGVVAANRDSAWLLEFSDETEVRHAGGKGRQLSAMVRQGVPTPSGVNITAAAYRAYLRANPALIKRVQQTRELDVTDAITRQRTSRDIQAFMMTQTHLPRVLHYAVAVINGCVTRQMRREGDLGPGEYPRRAYRGSGLAEDTVGSVAWFQTTTGAQPGQGTTRQNIPARPEYIDPNVLEVFAGVFNDQIFGYRDTQFFFEFANKLGHAKYRQMTEAIRQADPAMADLLDRGVSPRYVPLRAALRALQARSDGAAGEWLALLEDAADEILDPMNLVTGAADQQMVESHFSGTAFTSDLATGLDGTTWARRRGEFPEGPEDSFEGYTRFITVNVGGGLGSGIVDGAFQPDMVKMWLPDPKGPWIPLAMTVGRKEKRLVFNERAFAALAHRYTEAQVRELARLYVRVQDQTIDESGRQTLQGYGIPAELIETWTAVMQPLWIDPRTVTRASRTLSPIPGHAELLQAMGLTADEFFTLAHLVRHLNRIGVDGDTVSYLPTSEGMAGQPVLPPEGWQQVARLVQHVANLMGRETAQKTGRWDDRRDIEFAIEPATGPDDPNPFKFQMRSYNLVTGELGPLRWFRAVHIQNRPVNPPREATEPDDIIIKRLAVDQDYIEREGIQPVADRGLKTFGAGRGEIYIVDHQRDLAEQEAEIDRLGKAGRPVCVVLQMMGFEHDPIVEAANRYGGGAIVMSGNDTSHAYLFSVEQKIPIVVNPTILDPSYLEPGKQVIVDGQNGRVWPGDRGLPLIPDDFVIRADLVPAGTKAGVIVSTPHAAMEIARLGTKSALSRIEAFFNQTVRIYPTAAYDYDRLVRLANAAGIELTDQELLHLVAFREQVRRGWDMSKVQARGWSHEEVQARAQTLGVARTAAVEVAEAKLTVLRDALTQASVTSAAGLDEIDIDGIRGLLAHPEVIWEIRETIHGYPSAAEFVAEQMRYASNLLGAVFPAGNKIRDYDNKEKEAFMYDLVGAPLYLHYDDADPRFDSPLVGLRGSSLLMHPRYGRGFDALDRGILRSVRDGMTNNSLFTVFVRTRAEVRLWLARIEALAEEEGAYPEEIGAMIETPINLWIIDEILDELNAFRARHPQVKRVFISFGTNDWTKTTGMNNREDRDFTADLVVRDPLLVDVAPAEGRIELQPGVRYGPAERGKPFTITMDDEGAPVMLRMMEHAVSRAQKAGVDTSQCGQSIRKAVERGDYDTAARLIGLLDSFGVQSVNFVPSAMIDYDMKARLRRVVGRDSASVLGEVTEPRWTGVYTGEVVVIRGPDDIAKIRAGANKNKIVVLQAALPSKKALSQHGIPWDYLRYARAILLGPGVAADQPFFADDAELAMRIKGRVGDSSPLRDGEVVTVDLRQSEGQVSAVYAGELSTTSETPVLNEITIPETLLSVPTQGATFETSADVVRRLGIHPLAFEQPDAAVTALVGSQEPFTYLEEQFFGAMVEAARQAGDRLVVHRTFDMTRNDLRTLQGGEAIEKTKGREGENFDDRDYRLHGGARNISDFWRIHHAELAAYKRAKVLHPNLRLELTTMGVRSREILEAQLRVLRGMGIDPVADGVGLHIRSQADVLYAEGYIEQGIRFFSYDREELAAGNLAANLAHPDIFPADQLAAIIEHAVDKPLRYLHRAIAQAPDVYLAIPPQGGVGVTEMFATSSDEPVVYEEARFAQDLAGVGLVTGGGSEARYVHDTLALRALIGQQEAGVALAQGRSGANYRVSFEPLGHTTKIAAIMATDSGESEIYLYGVFQRRALPSMAIELPATPAAVEFVVRYRQVQQAV